MDQKPHAVCIPFPAQGHINPMLKFAVLLHHRGFHITFVNTHHNHRRLLRSRGPHALDGLPDFRFESIPDGLSPDDSDATQNITSLCDSTRKNCLAPLRDLLARLSGDCSSSLPVTALIADSIMSFALIAAEEVGVPGVLFRTASACSFMCYKHIRNHIGKGLVPLKDSNCLTNGYLDTVIDWIPGMKPIRLRDFPTFVRTTDPNSVMLDFAISEIDRASKASAIAVNTFDPLEADVLNAISSIYPRFYSIGPLQLLIDRLPNRSISRSIGSNLWREDPDCLRWLDSKRSQSVLYVNFGSVAVLTRDQLVEFAWGLANSEKNFMWIIRPDLVAGETAILPPEFLEDTKDRSLISGWCRQEEVLCHPSTGGFLTHCGWNSMLESLCYGVPVICWPFFADQMINCRYACGEWGVGMEIVGEVKREKVEWAVREMMGGEEGEKMKRKAMEWKREAEEAVRLNGSSYLNLEKLVDEVLLSKPGI